LAAPTGAVSPSYASEDSEAAYSLGETRRVVSSRYRAFISYSHRDARWAEWLHRQLEAYRPPRKLVGAATSQGEVPRRLGPIFRDREEIATAPDLGSIIRQALCESACLIVICSPSAARSIWVNQEILEFKRLGRSDRIYGLIVSGEPHASDQPGQEAEECFPPAFRFQLGADGKPASQRAEPVAADARPGRDGRRAALLKLVAGVLGLRYDALRRRDHQRQVRRLVALTATSLAAMVIAFGLATYALVQRASAVHETARASAEARTAEASLGFLTNLFRITDPTEARGNSVTAREMLDKGAKQLNAELAGESAIRARLLDTMGTAYMGLGLYPQAHQMLEQSVRLHRATASPPLRVASSLNHTGELLLRQADYSGATHAFQEALSLVPASIAERPLLLERARGLHGLGTVLAQQGKLTEARQSLGAALEVQRRLYPGAHDETASTLQDLAKATEEDGDLAQATVLMQESVDMHRKLHASEPYPALAEAINDLGYLREQAGDHAAAQALFIEALDMKRRLYGPKHPEVATGLANLALVKNNAGDFAASEDLYREALAMYRELVGEVHPDVADTYNLLAFVQFDRGEGTAALASERTALRIYRQLFSGDHPEVARTENRLGFWLTQQGLYPEAERDLREAYDMRLRLFGAAHPDVASSLTHLAILYIATGRGAEALDCSRQALAIYKSSGIADWKTAMAESTEGGALAELGRYVESEALLKHAIAMIDDKDSGAPLAYQRTARHYLDILRRRRSAPDRHSLT
jgi:tetratricopeptide (TPR) repeat protein